jgi:hypothetical protein
MANGNANGPTGSPDQISNLDQLSQLIMRLPRQGNPLDSLMAAAPPNGNGATARVDGGPPVAGTILPPRTTVPGGTADLEARRALPRTAPQPPAQPSDDPLISSSRAELAKRSSAIDDLVAQANAARAGIAAHPPVNPQDYKPKWYDRLLGAGEGFLAGYGRGNAGRGVQAGTELTRRGLRMAEAQRQRAVDPFYETLRSSEQEIPLLNAARESAWQTLQGGLQERREAETERKDTATAEYHDAIAEIRDEVAKGNIQKAQDLLDQKQKELEQRGQRDQATADYRNQLLDLRQQLLDLREKQGGQAKPQQFLAVQSKRDTAWLKARREYNANAAKLDPKDAKGMKEAQEDYYEKMQDAQDEYEQGIGVLGGTAPHIELERNHFGEPPTAASAAAPATPQKPATSAKADITPDPKQWKDKTKGLRVRQPSGAVQTWKLDNGKPTLVATEKSNKEATQ